MSYPRQAGQRPPVWFLIIVIITVIPAFRLPALISASTGEARVLLWLYPAMLLLGGWCAWRCYALERKEMAWILIVVCWLMTVSLNILMTA